MTDQVACERDVLLGSAAGAHERGRAVHKLVHEATHAVQREVVSHLHRISFMLLRLCCLGWTI